MDSGSLASKTRHSQLNTGTYLCSDGGNTTRNPASIASFPLASFSRCSNKNDFRRQWLRMKVLRLDTFDPIGDYDALYDQSGY